VFGEGVEGRSFGQDFTFVSAGRGEGNVSQDDCAARAALQLGEEDRQVI